MGADIKIKNSISKTQNSEPMGDLLIKSSSLKAVKVKKEEIPFLIDEIPILMIAASLAKGSSVFEGAQELRVKETDRIRSMSQNLKKMGVAIKVVKKGSSENIVVQGAQKLKAVKVKSFGDHRTAMSMIVAGLAAGGKTQIDDISCIDKSFPGFVRTLYKLS
jgi:3-phosphoshikimate 1-carboxyvinyltransferase